MAVSNQVGSIYTGVKKKKNLYAPMVQEQARQGVATQMVMASKDREAADQERQLQEDQFRFQQEQASVADQQWQKDYQAQQDALAQQRRQQNQSLIFGGLSTGMALMDAFGGWDAIAGLF